MRRAISKLHTFFGTGVALILPFILGAPVDAAIRSHSALTDLMARSPAPQMVPAGRELLTAEAVAAGIKNAIAYIGIGRSMEPLYCTNTAVIVVPITYDHIKRGMTVVYVNCDGLRVAHVIVGETRGGYLVQGVNNDEADADVVNEGNLIGVIIQAYACAETGFRHDIALQLKAKARRPIKKSPV
jgi:hypothetical protein